MSLILLPNDILMTICRYLACQPKDLVQFGGACKTTQAIENSKVFATLLKLCNPQKLKKRVSALRGPTGFDGLIDKAYRRKQGLQVKLNNSREIIERCARSQSESPSFMPALFSLHADAHISQNQKFIDEANPELIKASSEHEQLCQELRYLAEFNSKGALCGGVLYNLDQNVKSEIKKIQDKI